MSEGGYNGAMAENAKQKLIVILGPTASGKSALAVALARALGGAVISADSRQVYRGLDIGTGKITKREMRGVQHELLDVADPRRPYTAARYAKDAARAIRTVLAQGKVPILCGGTGFYIDAVLYGGTFAAGAPDHSFRKRMERLPTEALFVLLKRRDPARAGTVDRHNRRRLIRALEIIAATGVPVRLLPRTPRFETLTIGVARSKTELARRIRVRLARDLKRGLVAEVRRLHRNGLSFRRLDELGLEYALVARYLRGEIGSVEELEEALGRAIIQYAKRQMTWFRRDSEIQWARTQGRALALSRRFLAH